MSYIFKQEHFKWVLCSVLVIAGITLLFLGFFAIPIGKIDASVVSTFGMMLTFIGGVLGLDYKSTQKPQYITTEQVEECVSNIIKKKYEKTLDN